MVRQHTNLPFIMDENVNGIDMLLRMYSDKAADVVNLKISKFGGLTKAKQVGGFIGSELPSKAFISASKISHDITTDLGKLNFIFIILHNELQHHNFLCNEQVIMISTWG